MEFALAAWAGCACALEPNVQAANTAAINHRNAIGPERWKVMPPHYDCSGTILNVNPSLVRSGDSISAIGELGGSRLWNLKNWEKCCRCKFRRAGFPREYAGRRSRW